jgi:hypothetical protein
LETWFVVCVELSQNVLPNIKAYWSIPAITFFTFNSSSYFFPFSDFETEPEVRFHHKAPLYIEPFSSKTKKKTTQDFCV